MLRALVKRTIPPPNTRYTWVQDPIRFENALGKILPIASESNWDVRCIYLILLILSSCFKGDDYRFLDSQGNYLRTIQQQTRAKEGSRRRI